MKVYIPTFDRVDNQKTIYEFPESMWGGYVNLVAPPWEDHKDLPVIKIPKEYEGSISKKRQWILEYDNSIGNEYHVQVDDLVTFRKRDPKTKRLIKKHKFTEDDWLEVFSSYQKEMERGIALTSLNFDYMIHLFEDLQEIEKIGNFFCIDNKVLINNNIKFTDVKVFEDVHIELSLLERGIKTSLFTKWVTMNTPGKASGGNRKDVAFKKQQFDKNLEDFVKYHPTVKLRLKPNNKILGRDSDYKMTIYRKRAWQLAPKKTTLEQWIS